MRIPKYFHSKYFILSRRDTAIVNYQKLPFPDQGISETAKSAPGLYPEADSFRQHRTMGTAGFGGSFAPIAQHEKWEIHPVFPHFSCFRLCQNLSPNLLAPLCGAALLHFSELFQHGLKIVRQGGEDHHGTAVPGMTEAQGPGVEALAVLAQLWFLVAVNRIPQDGVADVGHVTRIWWVRPVSRRQRMWV